MGRVSALTPVPSFCPICNLLHRRWGRNERRLKAHWNRISPMPSATRLRRWSITAPSFYVTTREYNSARLLFGWIAAPSWEGWRK